LREKIWLETLRFDTLSATKNVLKTALGIKGQLAMVQFEVNSRKLEVTVPDDQYWISIKDILLNREYEYISGFALRNFKGLVVDAGANSGIFSLISAMFAKQVVALEPHPDNFRILQRNIERNGVKNIFAINKALWHEKGNLEIHEGTHSGEHSIYSPSTKSITASTTTLEELVKTFGNIDLLKIDIEGAEFPIFADLDSTVLDRINAVVGEVHLEYGNIYLIMDKLKTDGFKVQAFHPPLCAQKSPYAIRVQGMLRLRLLRRLLYTMAPLKAKTNSKLQIVFASKRDKTVCSA
jgi:FkbM family methyltransferase